MRLPIQIWVRLTLLLKRNEMKCLNNLFWKNVNHFEGEFIQLLKKKKKKWRPYWITLLFCAYLLIFSFIFSKLELILFYSWVINYYTRIFLILLPHTVSEWLFHLYIVFISTYMKLIVMRQTWRSQKIYKDNKREKHGFFF